MTHIKLMMVLGCVLQFFAISLAVFIAIQHYLLSNKIPEMPNDRLLLNWVIQYYGSGILALFSSIFLGAIGLRLIHIAGSAIPKVIPHEDRTLLELLIKTGNKKAIKQYIKLSALSGFTGKFEQIGFSGLPLATATLTIVFSGLSLLQPAFIDLAKLTLGAFIGSFVQKGIKGKRGRRQKSPKAEEPKPPLQ